MAIGQIQRAGVLAMSVAAPRRLAKFMLQAHSQPMTEALSTTGQVERVEIPGDEGATIRGWWIRPASGGAANQVVIMAHGWTAHAMRMSALIEPVLAMGYPILLYNARGHGDSDPTPYVSLAQFTRDLKSAIRFARGRVKRIAVIGHSLGASATLVAAADGEPIEAAVVLAPPADPAAVSVGMLDEQGLPGQVIMDRIRPYIEELMGRRFEEITPTKRIKEVTCPVLLAHGTADETVPVEHFHLLTRAGGENVAGLVVEGLNHHAIKAAPETLERLGEFLPRVFPKD